MFCIERCLQNLQNGLERKAAVIAAGFSCDGLVVGSFYDGAPNGNREGNGNRQEITCCRGFFLFFNFSDSLKYLGIFFHLH